MNGRSEPTLKVVREINVKLGIDNSIVYGTNLSLLPITQIEYDNANFRLEELLEGKKNTASRSKY